MITRASGKRCLVRCCNILFCLFVSVLFVDNLIEVAKRELAWEVDYERESECTKKFKALLEPYPIYYVPRVIGK